MTAARGPGSVLPITHHPATTKHISVALLYTTGEIAVQRHANKCRHVVIRTLSLRNVFLGKAIFTRHPYFLERVLGELTRI